ncbi:hypothetical protein D3C73_1025660 [compost metagenome]
MFGITGSDVEADQPIAFQAFDDDRILEHLVFDDFAADAPVGVPVEQQRGAGRPGFGEHTVEVGRGADGLPGAGVLRGLVASHRARLADRVERIGLAAEGAVPAGQRIKQQEHPEQLAQAFARRFVDELQCPHEQPDAGSQQANQQQGDLSRQDPAEQADRQPQQQDANRIFHVDQPRSAFRQPGGTAGGHQQQRCPHAQAEHEQFQATAQCVAAGADVKQRTGQRRRDARRNQQAGDHAQYRSAP